MKIGPEHISELVSIESRVHYTEPPPPGREPFVIVRRDSPVLLSAPHGARTCRKNRKETWHEEDEYTAGMALLLSELCGTSAIATAWRIDDYDPNWHQSCAYKDALADLIQDQEANICFVIDLHGAALHSAHLAKTQLIDLGLGENNNYLAEAHRKRLIKIIEARLGAEAIDRKGKRGFPATNENRIAHFCHKLGVDAVQIEMKPSIRVPFRRTDASCFAQEGSYEAPQENVVAAMQALVDFIEYLHGLKDS